MIRSSKISFYALIFIFLLSCDQNESTDDYPSRFIEIPLKHAKAFRIFRNGDQYILKTQMPGSNQLLQEIKLTEEKIKDGFKFQPSKVISISTTYLAFIHALKEDASIAGVSNPELIYNQEFRALIESNKIIDVGNDQSLNYEKLIELQPDIIFFYDFGPSTAAVVQRLEDLGLKVIRVAEFMEESPLGKAEWIKFFGAVYNKMDLADSIFNGIESSYLELLSIDDVLNSEPIVFTGLPWKGEWYQPGGASFQAKYLEDAGADYIWSENTSTSGITVIWPPPRSSFGTG